MEFTKKSPLTVGAEEGIFLKLKHNDSCFYLDFPPPNTCCLSYLKSFIVHLGVNGYISAEFCSYLITTFNLREV